MQRADIISRQIDAVKTKNMPDLREQFQELHGFDCGETNSRNLRKRIICRLQEIYLGGVDATDMMILEDIADRDPLANLKIIAATRAVKITGTKLYRIWKGRRSASRGNTFTTGKHSNHCRRWRVRSPERNGTEKCSLE